MSGTINSLGLGSGVLTADLLDKLKANDVTNIIAPIDRKITLQKQKDTAISLLNSLLSTFKTSASSLNDDALYQNRSVTGANGSVSVTASAGVAVQSFTISDVVLAKKHVIESGSFSASNSAVATGSGTMTLSIDGNSYGIDYTSLTTLEDLKAAINNKASDKVQASILQIGTNDYRLITTSKETGVTQSISMSDTGKLSEKIYKFNDTVSSAAFTSADALVASGAVAQSDTFSLSNALTDGGVSVVLNGVNYNVPFDTDHTTTLNNFKSAIDASGLYTTTISGNDFTITAKTAGVPYTITTPFSTNDTDPTVVASTTSVASNITPTGTYNVTMNGTTYNIAYDKDTTLTQLKDRINSAVGSNVASIKVEGMEFKLLLQSPTAGEDSTFTVSDTGGYLSTKLTTLAQNGSVTAQSVQEARDATFKYNGISMTRSTNNIEDTTVNGVEKKNAIIIGVSIKLLNETEDANIVIAQDVNSISTEMTTMVQSYNTLMSQLNDMTTSNAQTGAVGIFNGDSSIKSISREISRLITSTNSSGLSLPNFGIDLNQNGTMSFNSKTFLSKFNSDPSGTEAFLSGTTTVDSNDNIKTTDGIFSTLQNLLESYTETNGKLKTLTTETTNESKALSLSKTRSQALLDARYATMAARFSQYDSLISKLNSQFSSLQMQINAASDN